MPAEVFLFEAGFLQPISLSFYQQVWKEDRNLGTDATIFRVFLLTDSSRILPSLYFLESFLGRRVYNSRLLVTLKKTVRLLFLIYRLEARVSSDTCVSSLELICQDVNPQLPLSITVVANFRFFWKS